MTRPTAEDDDGRGQIVVASRVRSFVRSIDQRARRSRTRRSPRFLHGARRRRGGGARRRRRRGRPDRTTARATDATRVRERRPRTTRRRGADRVVMTSRVACVASIRDDERDDEGGGREGARAGETRDVAARRGRTGTRPRGGKDGDGVVERAREQAGMGARVCIGGRRDRRR